MESKTMEWNTIPTFTPQESGHGKDVSLRVALER